MTCPHAYPISDECVIDDGSCILQEDRFLDARVREANRTPTDVLRDLRTVLGNIHDADDVMSAFVADAIDEKRAAEIDEEIAYDDDENWAEYIRLVNNPHEIGPGT